MILTEKFTLAQIGEIVGKNPVTLRTHINRGLVTAQGPRHADGDKPAGRHSRFSFFTLMEFAMAYHLYDVMGLQLDRSFEHARHYAHISGGGEVYDLPDRRPSLPFHHKYGNTLWGIANDRSFEIPTESNLGKNLYVMMRHHLQYGDFIIVNTTEVFQRICSALKLCPFSALDEVYRENGEDR